jgi:hypothetical protein
MARAIGSAGERLVHTEEVTGSIPVSPTSSQAGSNSRNRPSLSSGRVSANRPWPGHFDPGVSFIARQCSWAGIRCSCCQVAGSPDVAGVGPPGFADRTARAGGFPPGRVSRRTGGLREDDAAGAVGRTQRPGRGLGVGGRAGQRPEGPAHLRGQGAGCGAAGRPTGVRRGTAARDISGAYQHEICSEAFENCRDLSRRSSGMRSASTEVGRCRYQRP